MGRCPLAEGCQMGVDSYDSRVWGPSLTLWEGVRAGSSPSRLPPRPHAAHQLDDMEQGWAQLAWGSRSPQHTLP
eukprot:scaffold10516_cov93-Isochrysis_galbana.AAC.1